MHLNPVLLALALGTSAPLTKADSTPTVPPAVAASTVQDGRLQAFESKAEQLAARLDKLDPVVSDLRQDYSRAAWAAGVVAFIIGMLGMFGVSWLRDRITRRVEDRVDAEVAARFDKIVPERIRLLEQKAQDELIRVAQVLACHGQRAYDAALQAFRWNGSVQSLREVSPGVRRAVIDSLYEAQTDRSTNRQSAWAAVKELVQDDPGVESQRLYFRLALSSKRYQEGLEYYRRIETSISDPEVGRMASALLRHQGDAREALALATKFRDSSQASAVSVASLHRDLGEFGAAHDVLKPFVERLSNSADPKPPEGWHRVLNTFIAICLDRNKPGDGVAAAQYVLRQTSRAVEVSTVGRLVHALDLGHPVRTDLLAKYRAAVESLPVGPEAAFRARITLSLIDGKTADAVARLRNEIERIETEHGTAKSDALYLRSQLGQLLCSEGRAIEALDVLFPASELAEAKYFLALANAEAGQIRDAVRWLREAAKEQPRWATIARDQPSLNKHQEILALLGELAAA